MTTEPSSGLTAASERQLSPDRVLAFTDATAAIIITILVLDVKIPDLGEGVPLTEALADVWPSLLAFVISFLLVGMYWVWHRSLFSGVRYTDTTVVWQNLLFLLFLSLIPFAASTLGEHSEDPTALHIYGAILIAVTLTRTLISWYLNRHPELRFEQRSKRSQQLTTIAAAMPLVVYIVAMIVASWAPWLSLVLYFLLPMLYFGFVAFLRSDPKTSASAQDLS